jgi:hypothetical protein
MFFLLMLPFPATAASVKPLEVFSEKILQREIEHFAEEHALASVMLRRALDRMNREMNIMSRETAQESLKLIRNVTERLDASMKSSTALSNYLSSNSARLKQSGHDRFLPLARLNDEIEEPYHKALKKFLSIATEFVGYCSDNFEAISSGSKVEGKRYEELYAAYLREMDNFNGQSIKRSQLLADWGSEFPDLWELMPR